MAAPLRLAFRLPLAVAVPAGSLAVLVTAGALRRRWIPRVRPLDAALAFAPHGSTSVPTYAASHGCVRLTVPAMNRWSSLHINERIYGYH